MRKIAAILILLLTAAAAWAGPAMYLRFSAEWSYLTNAFSDPLPVNASDSYLEDIEFIKRWNAAPVITFDTFFNDSDPAGLTLKAAFRFPVASTSIVHDGTSYVSHDSLSEQQIGVFLGIGPVFRYRFGIVDIGFSLRASLGSYDYFKTGLVFGVEAEPFVNIALTDYMYLSLGMKYDAHLIKFLDFTSSSIYEDGFIMMTAGGIVGIGFRFGGGDA